MRKFFVFVCLLFLTLSINVYAKDDVKSIDSFIDNVINEWVESKDDICIWNENTDIDLVIPLYNTDDVINGYIYNLKTDNKKTGYIQVRCIDGNYQVVNLGFEGENYLESWMYQNNLSMDVLEYSKVYYLGNFAYFVKDERKQILLDLENKTEFDAWTDSMKKFEERFTEIFSQKSEKRGIYSTAGTTVKVSNLSSASGYFRTTGYYSSYTNHCSPTAGTNLMLYWNKAKGYTSLGSTQTTIFTSLYSRMGTSATSGTLWSNIAPGLRSYANSKYPSLSVSCAPFYGVNVTKIMAYTAQNRPVLVEVENWTPSSSHTINVWGYNCSGTADYMYITHNNNSGSTSTFSLLAFSQYILRQGEYFYY